MILLIVLIWFLLLFLIPPALLASASNCDAYPIKTSKAIGRLLLSFLVYLLISLIALACLLFLFLGPHPGPNQVIPYANKVVSLIIVLGYGAAGWLLCSFANGKFVKPWMIFSFKAEKPLSLFDAE